MFLLSLKTRNTVERRPNILVIMTDQQCAKAMSCSGNQDLKTPAMDRIAKEGIRFTKAYSHNPICCPSRSSMFTGLFSHQTGVDQNVNMDFQMKGASFVKGIRSAGYRTGYFGKWHVPMDLNDPEVSGFDCIGFPEDNSKDPLVTPKVIEFLNASSDDSQSDASDEPFFAVASYHNPHDICQHARIASGMDDRYPNGALPEPVEHLKWPSLPHNHCADPQRPEAIDVHQNYEGMKSVYPTVDWPKGSPKWREYLWVYYRMVELVDAEIQRILDALEEKGLLENTLILFTSDHGDGMGSHQWNQKSLFYEEVSNIPLLITSFDEQLKGSTSDLLANVGVDFAATLLGAAGLEHGQLPGVDVRQAAETGEVPKRPFIVGQSCLHQSYGVYGEHRCRMIRSEKYKYVAYDGGERPEELFDLENDPGEQVNLTSLKNCIDILEEHRAWLRFWCKENGDDFELSQVAV
jgi:arylsulfatase A-like enzyme